MPPWPMSDSSRHTPTTCPSCAASGAPPGDAGRSKAAVIAPLDSARSHAASSDSTSARERARRPSARRRRTPPAWPGRASAVEQLLHLLPRGQGMDSSCRLLPEMPPSVIANFLPFFHAKRGIHRALSISRCSHARAIAQSRFTVAAEIPSTSATSDTSSPNEVAQLDDLRLPGVHGLEPRASASCTATTSSSFTRAAYRGR